VVLLRTDVDNIAILTLNRPELLNSLNTQLGLELERELESIEYSEEVKVVILTGTGEKSFSVGGDFKERGKMSDEDWMKQHHLFEKLAKQIRNFPKPIIAAVNGFALGGGFELALSSDFIVASENSKYGLPEVSKGIIPGIGGAQLLSKFLPKGMALELLFTGRHISATEAHELGIVNHLVPLDKLLDTAINIANLIAENSPNAVRLVKRAYLLGSNAPLEEGILIGLECYKQAIVHPDRIEGSRAFLEKRKPVYLN